MYDTLFAPSWYLLAAAGLLGLAFLVVGLRRGLAAQRNIGFAIAAATLLWLGADYFVTTPSEAATIGTQRFAQAVVARDRVAMRALLSPNVSLFDLGRDDILTNIPDLADQWGLKSALITSTEVEPRDSEILANVRVFSSHDRPNLPDHIPSDWQFIWQNEGDGWKIVQIVPLKLSTLDVSSFKGFFIHRRR